jgi:hypothetical protein
MDTDNKVDVVYRIHGMSLQCFALCIRKLTDKQSERSVRKLINMSIQPRYLNRELAAIVEIYSHYEKFLNQFVVHQDVTSVHDGLKLFPDTEVIEADLKHLEGLYIKLVKEICTKYINVKRNNQGYGQDLDKLTV